MAHGSNDGYVVDSAAIAIIFYNLDRHQKPAGPLDLPRLASALGNLIGDPDFGPGGEYGGPTAYGIAGGRAGREPSGTCCR